MTEKRKRCLTITTTRMCLVSCIALVALFILQEKKLLRSSRLSDVCHSLCLEKHNMNKHTLTVRNFLVVDIYRL